MVGGNKRDEGQPAISSTNIFSALESRRKKSSRKRLDKDQKGSSSLSSSNVGAQPALQSWAPTPVSVTLWADCEDDDDDYFAMPALPPLLDQEQENAPTKFQEDEGEEDDASHGEESEGDEDVEEEGNEENEEPQCPRTKEFAADVSAAPPAPVAAREPDRQLSKKQLKKKELAELEAVLAELGLNQEDKKEAVEVAETKEMVDAKPSVDGKEAAGSALAESKSSKRRKAKREKSFKEGKEEEGVEATDGLSKDESVIEDVEVSARPVDRSEVLKKLPSMKKKKSFKDSDLAAKAAAAEAAVRAGKLAAAKKKEKTHYNQQPGR